MLLGLNVHGAARCFIDNGAVTFTNESIHRHTKDRIWTSVLFHRPFNTVMHVLMCNVQV